jgi:hypothetical protein
MVEPWQPCAEGTLKVPMILQATFSAFVGS